MIGHLGSRVSALLDGQLTPAETERCWQHVHACHACRDLVEREGWVKSRLSGLGGPAPAPGGLPVGLRGALHGHGGPASAEPGGGGWTAAGRSAFAPARGPLATALLAGGGAAGAAALGVALLVAGPTNAPVRPQPPASDLSGVGGGGATSGGAGASSARVVPGHRFVRVP